MDLLNNVGTVVGIVVNLMTIVGSLVHVLIKANFFQRRQTALLASSCGQSVSQTVAISLNWCDWMEVLWGGVVDCFKARKGKGWMVSVEMGVGGGFAAAMVSSVLGSSVLSTFIALFISLHILFYVYFLGRRIEKMVEKKNRYLARRLKSV